ncbi:MAG TPA: LEA type 2 family protein [Candidatus Aminicenantes bacterium]|nr:LEA type 2 family protein [Candidatus Aminicenantes bacterium]HRY65467.1 LEA type 2 family protein [Candidatus Aminicenantes bacterium]HRZ72065.1 LEA type 2 family protein [Candidatus Aminicenantes bacterium]
MDNRTRSIALLALAAFGLGLVPAVAGAAAAPAAGARDDVVLTLTEKVIKDLSSSGLVLAFHVLVSNPAAAPRELVRYRYRVRIDQKEYINTEVSLDAPLAVPGGGRTLIALPVKITYELLFKAVGPIEGRALCDIVGDMYFRNERQKEQKAPFAYSGEFPIFKDPEIDLPALDVLDLTVGGADVVFKPLFRNLNGYDLIVEAIDYELFFSGRPVLAGAIPGDKSLPANGEKSFALPFLLDFFEAGEDVRAGFAGDEFPCRFTGRIVIASAWGRLVIRFDRSQPLKLDIKR